MTTNNPSRLANKVIAAVRGGGGILSPLASEVRTELLRQLPLVLVDRLARHEYVGALKAARRSAGSGTRPAGGEEVAPLPTQALLSRGLTALSDSQLVTLAADPVRLTALADLIDEAAEHDEVGEAWWEAIAQMGHAGVYEESPAASASPIGEPVTDVYRRVAALPPIEVFVTAAAVLRRDDPPTLLASGTSEESVRLWIDGSLFAVCMTSPSGLELFPDLAREDVDRASLVRRTARFLAELPRFAQASEDELTTLALAVVNVERHLR